MAKDNTILYVGLGLAAVYFLSKKTAAAPIVTPGYAPGYTAPVSQPSSLILPLVNKLTSSPGLFSSITNLFGGQGTAPALTPGQTAANNQAAAAIFSTPSIGPVSSAPAPGYTPGGSIFSVPALAPVSAYNPVITDPNLALSIPYTPGAAYIPLDSVAPVDMSASYDPASGMLVPSDIVYT